MSKPKRPRIESPNVLGGEQRINKLLAAAGLGSRRQVDELITDGRVEIDGQTVTQVGIKVDADKCKISVDGEALKRHRPMYFAVNKPAGVLCTNRDPEGRPRVIDLIPGNNRLFPVGRLDASSTGLILLTNDGELAQRLAHPKHSVPKNYFVVVAGQVEPDSMRRLQRGIYLAEGLARVDGAKIRRVRKGCTEIEITLSEGKNREIRRVLARLGHRVVTLRRLAIGPLRLATLPEGSFRPLTHEEVSALYQAVDDIKREKRADRKERDKRRSAEMNQLNAEQQSAPELASADESEVVFPKNKSQKTKKKGAKEGSVNWEEQADAMLERLPPLSDNPYRMDDDDDEDDDAGLADAVLVRESGPVSDTGNRKGKVLGYSEDASDSVIHDDDDLDSTGMGFVSFDDEDDEDDEVDQDDFMAALTDEDDSEDDESDADDIVDSPVPANSPWAKITKRPRGNETSRGARNEGGRSDRNRKPAGRPTAPPRREGGQGAGPAEGARVYQPRRGRGKPASARKPAGDVRHESTGHVVDSGSQGDRHSSERGTSVRLPFDPSSAGRRQSGAGYSDGPRRSSGTGRPARRSSGAGRTSSSGRGGPEGSRDGAPARSRGFGGSRGARTNGTRASGPRESFGGESGGGENRSRPGRPLGGGAGKRPGGKRAGGKPFGGPKGGPKGGRRGGRKGR